MKKGCYVPDKPINQNLTLATAGKNLGTAGGPKLPLSLETKGK